VIEELDSVYITGTALHECLIDPAPSPAAGKGVPLVVALHGGGARPTQLAGLWEGIPNRGFTSASLQGPFPFALDGGIAFDWGMWPSGDQALIARATRVAERYVLDATDHLVELCSASEPFLLGFSQGAIFAYLIGLRHPERFGGLICLSGPGLGRPLKNPFLSSLGSDWLPRDVIEAANRLPVFVAHGTGDELAPLDYGRGSRDLMASMGYDVTFCAFEGGHILPPEPVVAEIVEWISSHARAGEH
jgi:phospholipase/carboxylesterase